MTFWCMFWEITIWPKASPDDDSGGGESTRFIVPPRFNFSPHSSSCPLFSYSTKCFHLLLNCCCCYDAFGFFICEAMPWPVQQKTSTTTTSMLLLAILFWIPFSWKKSMKSASLCRFFMLLFCASLLVFSSPAQPNVVMLADWPCFALRTMLDSTQSPSWCCWGQSNEV